MDFKIFYHDIFEKHIVPNGHPERSDRIKTLNNLIINNFKPYLKKISIKDTKHLIRKVHTDEYLNQIYSLKTNGKLIQLDQDTFFSENTLIAAETVVSGIIQAIDHVMKKDNLKAFVCSRPPGHHAEPDKAMGFCFFSNAAIGAKYALDKFNLNKVAVLDFDVHHGNGTQKSFESDPNLIYASTHEMPLFPGTGNSEEVGVGNIINEPIEPSTNSKTFIDIWELKILPRIKLHNPELLIISSGFDAHEDDPLSSINLKSKDYKNLTNMIVEFANKNCKGRLVSILEGGYNLNALNESVKFHINSLIV